LVQATERTGPQLRWPARSRRAGRPARGPPRHYRL